MTEEEYYGSKDLNENNLFWLCLGRHLEGFKRHYHIKYGMVRVQLKTHNDVMNEIDITCLDEDGETKSSTIYIPYKVKEDFTLDFTIDL